MTSYTKGPWATEDRSYHSSGESRPVVFQKGNEKLYYKNDRHRICTVSINGVDGGPFEASANAKLISHAPCMYDMLRSLRYLENVATFLDGIEND